MKDRLLKMANAYYEGELDKSKNFKQNYVKMFGEKDYELFILTNGFGDCAKGDVGEQIFAYGWDDDWTGMIFFHVPWNELIEKLEKESKKKEVEYKVNMDVKKVKTIDPDLVEVHVKNTQTKKNILFESRNVIYATTVVGLKSYENKNYHKYITDHIHCQSFSRVYMKTYDRIPEFEKSNHIHMNNFLQKAIPMGNNIIMIAYNDLENSHKVNKMTTNQLKKKIENMFDINVCDLKKFYWPCGTHIYGPLKYFKTREEFINVGQHPEPNVFVVGEWISDYQGWSEGALDSVLKILPKL
jgi:hypothetical protein